MKTLKPAMLSQVDSCHLFKTQQTIMAATVPLLLSHFIHISVHVQRARNKYIGNTGHQSNSNMEKPIGREKRDSGASYPEILLNTGLPPYVQSAISSFMSMKILIWMINKWVLCVPKIYELLCLKNYNVYSEKNNVLGQEGPAFNFQPGQGLSVRSFHILLPPTVQRHAQCQLG